MSSVVIAGNTSGTVTLSAPDIAGTTTLTLPTTSGTIITTAGGAAGSFTTLSSSADASFATSSGNVGIGTSSPARKLHVSTSSDEVTRFESSSNPYISWYSGSTRRGYIQFDSTSTAFYNESAVPMLFGTNSAERMRIASNGQMLLGTTTNAGRSPPLIISNDSGTTNWAVGPSTGGSTQFYVSAGAGVYLSTTAATSWTANSDINLKNITGKIENALDAISTLTPAKFTWKSDEENTPQIGLIAQEVEKVLPEVVDRNADGYLGVRYTETIPLLVAAIQELTAKVKELEAKVGV